MGIIDIGSLETVLSRYDPIILHSSMCVRERYGTASCNECVKLCPRMAISFTPNLNIDFSLCDGCLVCTALCPTGVFLARAGSDIAILKQVKEKLVQTGDISFACTAAASKPPVMSSFMGSIGTSAAADEGLEGGLEGPRETLLNEEAVTEEEPVDLPEETVNSPEDDDGAFYEPHNHVGCVKVPCLGRIDDAIIVGSVGNGAGKVWLDTSPCGDCWRKNGFAVAQQSFSQAAGILSLYGHQSRISFSARAPFSLEATVQAAEQPSAEVVAAPSHDKPGVSRRNFFSGLKGGAMQTGGAIIDHKVKEFSELTDTGSAAPVLDRRLPTRHALLIHFMGLFGDPVIDRIDAGSLPFAQLTVADDCIFCGHCEKFCPTEAIAVVNLPESKIIGSLSTLCVDCGLCADVCGPGSIHFRDAIDVRTLAGGKVERLLAGHMAKCKECKQEFFTVSKQKVCPFCELRRKKLGDMSWS